MRDVLRYESRDGGTLEAGEHLLWEGGGKRQGRALFRITNRRAFCTNRKENLAKHLATIRWPFHEMIVFRLKKRGAILRLGTKLWISCPDDWTTVAGHLLRVNRGRLTRRRRGAKNLKTETVMDAVPIATDTPLDYSSVATDLGLIEAERVIWTGQPMRNLQIRWPAVRRKIWIAAWRVVPSVLAFNAMRGDQPEAVKVVFGLVAAVWFFSAIYSLTVKPIVDRWQLARTRYVLTTRRAFVIRPYKGGRCVCFVFVDALPAQFERVMQPDGSGDITVGRGIGFRQIADAAVAHQHLVDAVLAARRDLPDLGWQDQPVVVG